MKYSRENNVLHGFPFANVHPHVVSKKLSHFDNSDACSDSHLFCLALEALAIANCLGVDELAAGICGVHTASGEAVLNGGSVVSASVKESGSTGNSMIAVNLVMTNVLIFA